MRLLGYTRISDRREDSEGHAAQAARLRAWARANGHRIVRVIREDAGISGAAGERLIRVERAGKGGGNGSRAGWAEVLNALDDGEAGGVVVRELERLSRDVLVQEALMRDVWEQGRELYSTAPSENNLRDDPQDPTRKLLRVVVGAVHEHAREMTRLRLMRGKQRKAASGGYIGGTARLGSRPAKGGGLEPDPAEQDAIARAAELRAAGASLRQIGEALTAEGHRPRGRDWHPTTVARVLTRAG
jgi:DNA invertase Pin-like site-specific DNA recombinase